MKSEDLKKTSEKFRKKSGKNPEVFGKEYYHIIFDKQKYPSCVEIWFKTLKN